jgi:UDP-GlcNAc:undecaprenyl-phosphate GlcNAc-1-phosphate transferase
MLPLVIGLSVAFVISLLLTPAVRRIALRYGVVDLPDGRRKLHESAIPLGGGVAVLLGTVGGLAVGLPFYDSVKEPLAERLASLGGFLGAALVIVVVGLLDDRFRLRGRQKLAGQIVAASILLMSGLIVERIQILGWSVELGLLAIPFTLFWLLGAINALNLIDGIDGLACSVGIILTLAIAGMAWMTNHAIDAVIAVALCGALIGFLRYNFPPASIFLGDTGSMLIGLLLGGLAISSTLKGPATVALAAPAVMWTIPILDVSMAILRRKLTGRSVYETDRGHLHHCLLRRGFSNRSILLWVGVLCSCTAAGALVSVARQNEWLAVASGLAVVATLVLTRWFGHSEFLLLGGRLKELLTSLVKFPHERNGYASPPFHARLTGTRDWDDLWTTLTEYAEQFDLTSVQLNVHMPALNEDYHVNWERRGSDEDRTLWSTEIPLMMDRLTIGRLRIRGNCKGESVCAWMGDLIAGLKPFETQMTGLLLDVNLPESRIIIDGNRDEPALAPHTPHSAAQKTTPVKRARLPR